MADTNCIGHDPTDRMNTLSEAQMEIAREMEPEMKDVVAEKAKRRIDFGLRHGGETKEIDGYEEFRNLPARIQVLLYRTGSRSWEGPWNFTSIDGQTCMLQTEVGSLNKC